MLREIARNLWVAEQPLKYFGLSVGTRMTVIRLKNDELVIISPIKIEREMLSLLNTIGRVNYIIAPNLYHYLFVADFKTLYPEAQLWAAPDLKLKTPELPIDRVITDCEKECFEGVEYLLFDGFKTLSFNGISPLNECVFFHLESQTLILTDTAFHFDESFSLVTQLVSRAIGGYKKLSPSLLERLATQETEKVKQAVKNVLAWDFKRVIMAHGSIIERDAKRQFKEGYEKFLSVSF
jgi:hypothetical protein